jgi:hypothetical protein
VRPPRPKPVHYANLMREDGAASALCFAKPHPIDLRRASWTNRREAATCPKCLRLFVDTEALDG